MTASKIPFISIIIPAYNYAHTLERAIYSVHSQLDKDCELLIINDGSTDNTAQLLENTTKNLVNIKVFHKLNGGAASARNEGIRQAKGDYLIFLDADDELCKDAILNIRKHLEENPEVHFIIGGHCSISLDGKKKMHPPSDLPKSSYDKLNDYLIKKSISLSNGACVMHKNIFNHYLYPEHFRNSEDIPMFAYALVNFSCSTLDIPIANIYKHHDSLRHNAKYAENVGLKLVEEVFDTNRISDTFQPLKKHFLVQRLLSLSRVSHEDKRYQQCIMYFIQAFKLNWQVVFKLSYSKKFTHSLFKLN